MYPEVRCLDYWEEAIGLLNELEEKEGFLFAKIGKISLVLPIEMEKKMRPYIGKRASVLHTDIPNKSYLFRLVSDQEMSVKAVDDHVI